MGVSSGTFAATKPDDKLTSRLSGPALADVEHLAQWQFALAEYELYQRGAGMSEKTIQNRRDCLLLLAGRVGKPPADVTHRDLLSMLTRPHNRSGDPLSPGTKQAERSYLRSFFAWMLEEQMRDDDPALRLPKVKTPRRKPRPFRVEQVDSMLDSGAYSRTRDIITIAALTGLRIGEIVKIRGEDVDLQGRVLFSLRKGGLQHTVALHSTVLELAERYPSSGWWFPSPYKNTQFPAGDGHILMKSASDAVGKAIRRAGIHDRRITGHSLRHFYATQLLAGGASIRVIQEMLGHASLATTQIYVDVSDQQLHDATAVLVPITHRAGSGRSKKP